MENKAVSDPSVKVTGESLTMTKQAGGLSFCRHSHHASPPGSTKPFSSDMIKLLYLGCFARGHLLELCLHEHEECQCPEQSNTAFKGQRAKDHWELRGTSSKTWVLRAWKFVGGEKKWVLALLLILGCVYIVCVWGVHVSFRIRCLGGSENGRKANHTVVWDLGNRFSYLEHWFPISFFFLLIPYF